MEQCLGLELTPSQKDAVQLALASKLLVITGGPGVGKTTLINAILRILTARKLRIQLCAPTGRAAKCMAEFLEMLGAGFEPATSCSRSVSHIS